MKECTRVAAAPDERERANVNIIMIAIRDGRDVLYDRPYLGWNGHINAPHVCMPTCLRPATL